MRVNTLIDIACVVAVIAMAISHAVRDTRNAASEVNQPAITSCGTDTECEELYGFPLVLVDANGEHTSNF